MSAKTKDGFYKVNYDNTYVLLANGSQKQFGNDTNNIPVSNGIVNSNLNADLLDGLHIHTGINNEVNKIVRTNSDGTIMAGWINTISGDMTTTPFTRVYVSNDNYIRYVSNTNFIKGIGGPFLPLVGGTMTGTIHREYSSSDDTPFIWINSGDYDNYIFQVSSSTVSHQYFGYSLKYIGTGSGIKKFLRLYADNQNSTDIIALSVNQSGNIGIGDDALDSYRLYVSGNSVFYGHLYPEATNTYDLGSSSLRWRKLYIGTADSYGTTTKPIYWNNGVPTACTYSLSADVNSGTKDTLAYYSTATSISSYTSTIGSNTKLFYLNAGVPIESTGNVGSGVIPIYLLGGTLIASTSTVGATNKPIWLSSGTLTQFNSTIGATNQPIFLNNGEIIATTANIGSGVKPIYMSSGQILASTSTIGGTLQPVWLNTGIITAFTTTKGSPTTGVYLASGVISEMTYSLGSSVSAGTENRIAWYSGANVISSGTVTTDGEYLGSISYLSINKEHQTGYRLYVNGTSYLSDISLIANSTIIVPTVSYSTLISSYGLRSDYTSVGYPTEDFLKAWCKWVYAQNNVPDHTVHSYISPNSRGYIVADVYASGINSTTGLPEHITGRYYPHGGGEIIFGTSYGTWYYRNAYDDSYHPNADYIYVEATSTGDWLYPNFTYYGNTYRREYVYTKLRFQPSTGHLLINGAFDNSPQKYDDGNDRPGISILGSYPQLALISNVSNSSHGPVLAIGAYDNSGTNSGSFKSFRFGTPGVSATWLDLAYGTHSNVHDGIAGWNASGNGLQITRFHNDRTIYNYGTVYFGVASYGATYYHSGYTVYSYDKVSHYSYTYGRSIIGDSSMWTWTLGVNGRVGIATNDATDPGYLNIAHNTFAINFRQGGSWTTGFFYGTYGNEYIALTTQQSVTSIIFGNGYAPNSLTSGSFISGDGGHGYGTSTDIIQIKQNCMNIGDIWTNGVGPDYKLKVNGRTRINYTGGDTDPSLVVTATSNGSWRYVAAFLAPNLTSGYNVYVPVGTELSTRNAIGLTHYTYGSGSTSNYAAMEIWGVGNIQRWYYGDMRTWFAGRVDSSGFYHNSYGSYDYLLTSNGDARHMNTLTVSNSDMLDGYHHDHFQVRHWTTQRDFSDGTLIYTDINYSNWSGDPFYGVISGNTYGRIGSAYTTFQGYLWDDGIINYSVSNLGIESIGDIIAMNISGNLCFWFPRQSYWEGYSVEIYSAYDYRTNRVTNVTNSSDPGGSKRVNLNNNTYYNFHNGNSFWANQPVRNYSDSNTDPTFLVGTFTRNWDHGISVATIRGRGAGSCSGEYIHLYERVHIGSPNGWGSREAPSYGLSTYGGAWLATDTGSVGIGCTDPSQKLDVNGSIILRQYSSQRQAGIIGYYDYTKAAAIWAMGESYQIASDGSSLGNLYGAAYVYEGQAGTGGRSLAYGHQFVWADAGDIRAALGYYGVWARRYVVAEANDARIIARAQSDSSYHITLEANYDWSWPWAISAYGCVVMRGYYGTTYLNLGVSGQQVGIQTDTAAAHLHIANGGGFLYTGDGSLKLYEIDGGYDCGPETIGIQTCFDGVTNPDSHSYVNDYWTRCFLALQPRNGVVGIGCTTYNSTMNNNGTYKLIVNGSARFGTYDLDNSTWKNTISLFANQSSETWGEGIYNEVAWGIGFKRQWSSGSQNVTSAGIYAVGSSGWRTGLAFRVKDNTGSDGYSHDRTALWLSPGGRVGINTGDPSQRLHVWDGLIAVTCNGYTLTMGNQNGSWTHMTTGGTHFWFNPSVCVDGDVYPYSANNRWCGTTGNYWYRVSTAGILHPGVWSSEYFFTTDGGYRYWPDLYDNRYYKQFGSNNIDMSSFWCGYGTGMTTQIGPTGHWWHIFSSGWSDNSYWISQIAVPTADGWDSNHMMYRTYHGSDYGWRTVLDNTNYTSYTDGRYLQYEGWWNSGSGQNVNDAEGMVFVYADHGSPSGWGILSTFSYARSSNYKMQLFSNGYTDGNTYYRNKSSDRGGWGPWIKIIDTTNVSSTLWWADQTVKTYADSGTWPTFGSCYVNDWVRIGNSTGIYWNGVYGAHFRVNLASSYGQFQILGNKNGYSGFHFGDSTGWMTIMDNYTDKGCYQENWGWLWYFNASNGTLGLRTSSNTGYAVTCQGDFYCRGGWLRTEGGTGWYNESYGGGIWMADGTYVRVYNSKRFWVDNVTHCSSASESVWPGDAAIEVRERGRGTTGISHDYANAPRIGFHWGNRYWANFVYFDNWFRFMTESCGGYIGNMASCYSLNGYTGNYTGTSWTIAGYAGQLYFGGNFHIDSQNGYHLYLNYYTSYNIYACYGGGTFYAAQGYFYVNTSGAYHTSDIRKKYDIRDILYKDINDLFKTENGYIRYFKWKETDKPAYGFIAQEIQDYCPECIELDKTGYYSVNYNVALSKIIGVLFKKVKEQDRIIKDLQKRMEEF